MHLISHRPAAPLAASTGYAEQSHMNRDFVEFAGVSPSRYRAREPDGFLHHRAQHVVVGGEES
jgi:AraC-like DNA-binding protein